MITISGTNVAAPSRGTWAVLGSGGRPVGPPSTVSSRAKPQPSRPPMRFSLSNRDRRKICETHVQRPFDSESSLTRQRPTSELAGRRKAYSNAEQNAAQAVPRSSARDSSIARSDVGPECAAPGHTATPVSSKLKLRSPASPHCVPETCMKSWHGLAASITRDYNRHPPIDHTVDLRLICGTEDLTDG